MATEIRPFADTFIGDSARMLADRHRAHRVAAPGLDPAFEDRATVRGEIERLASTEGASGAVALRDGVLVGYLLGVPRDASTWGPNVWVESGGHAATEPAIARDLYRVAAASWVEEGRTRHHVLVPASDQDLLGTWFSLGFGQQQVHALREPPPASFRAEPPAGLQVRRATRADLEALAILERVLPQHHARSPVFSQLRVPALDDMRAELADNIDDPRFATFVAERAGLVVASATGCSLELSSTNTGLIRPGKAGFLAFAAVLPEARGLGAGRAVGEAVLAWARDAGYPWVATDWRSTNLEASRTWPRLGFRPTFLRLHRAIA